MHSTTQRLLSTVKAGSGGARGRGRQLRTSVRTRHTSVPSCSITLRLSISLGKISEKCFLPRPDSSARSVRDHKTSESIPWRYNLLRAVNIVGVKALVEAPQRLLRALHRAIRRAHGSSGWFYARVFARIVRREQNFVLAGLPA